MQGIIDENTIVWGQAGRSATCGVQGQSRGRGHGAGLLMGLLVQGITNKNTLCLGPGEGGKPWHWWGVKGGGQVHFVGFCFRA
jgi:hypothetical protein